MTWAVEFSESARKQFRALDKSIQTRIARFIPRITDNPRAIGKALQGELGNYWSYRVGEYRLIADLQDDKVRVLVVAIDHRSEVYRN